MSPGRVVLATASTDFVDGNERLLQLAALLVRSGADVELIALSEGSRSERFAAVAPLTIVDRYRRRGPARLPNLLGLRRVCDAVKSVRLRRWLASRGDATFVIHHPLAASLLRYLPRRPARVIAGLPDAFWDLDRFRGVDRRQLADADGWIVAEERQAASVAVAGAPVVTFTGSIVDQPPSVGEYRPLDGEVVLLAAADPFRHADHASEVIWQLHRRDAGTRFRWVVPNDEGAWLARHDLAHAELVGAVTISTADDPEILGRPAVIVRCGADAIGADLLIAAAHAGVPVLGWGLEPLLDIESVPGLDVESAVEDISALLSDASQAAWASRRSSEAAARSRDRRAEREVVELVIGPGRVGSPLPQIASTEGSNPVE